MASSQGKHMPKDTQIIVSIMKDLGIHEFDQQVLNHLLEFNYSKKIYRFIFFICHYDQIIFDRVHDASFGRRQDVFELC